MFQIRISWPYGNVSLENHTFFGTTLTASDPQAIPTMTSARHLQHLQFWPRGMGVSSQTQRTPEITAEVGSFNKREFEVSFIFWCILTKTNKENGWRKNQYDYVGSEGSNMGYHLRIFAVKTRITTSTCKENRKIQKVWWFGNRLLKRIIATSPGPCNSEMWNPPAKALKWSEITSDIFI